MITGTIMTRKNRSRKRERSGKRNGLRSTKPPSLRSLFAWSVPFVAIAVLVDGLVYCGMAGPYQKYGHWYFPLQRTIMAAFLSMSAVLIPILWLWLRRKSGK